MRITVACPEGLIPDANHFAMAMSFSEADAQTYRSPVWQDADGNLYAAASFTVREGWVDAAQSTLDRPEWDAEPYTINMTGAGRAQAVLMFWTPADGGAAPQASPDALTAIGGMDGLEALAAMGLSVVTEVEI